MKNKAFTLVELMVVIAIIAILAVGSITSYSSYLDKARLSKALQFSASVLQKVKVDAIALGVNPIGVWNMEEGSGTSSSDNGGANRNLTLEVSGSTRISEWTTDTPHAGSRYALSFENQGRARHLVGTGGTILVDPNGVTVSAWVKPTELQAYNYYFFESGQWNLRMRNNGQVCYRRSGVDRCTDSNAVQKDSWHYILFSYKNGTGRIYIDGEKKMETDISTFAPNRFANMYSGYGGGSTVSFQIDDLQVWPLGYIED